VYKRQAFDALKNHYRAGETEAWVAEAWASANPAEAYPPAHLSLSDLGDLAQAGWELGNHTLSHATLAALDADGHAAQIEGNESLLRGAGLPLQPWLAIPNGWAKHVNQHTADWLNAHPDYHAFFGTGGVNLRPSRAAWRRIAIADWDLPTFRRALQREASRTRRVNA
jgi:peptidoglycan/xylan/chitin deacetylase (PgdA/CDA1 family)